VLTREEKKNVVANLSEKFSRATSVFVADYRGLTVEEVGELRGQIREGSDAEYEYQVAKNSLLRLASEGSEVAVLKDQFVGPTAVAISYGDPVSLAKILVNYAKGHDAFEIRAGMLDGKAIDQDEVAHLATLPNLLELRGKLVGLLQAPAGKLARLLKEPSGQLARLVMARKDTLEE
jgi:large subunit ribosomal protein L10